MTKTNKFGKTVLSRLLCLLFAVTAVLTATSISGMNVKALEDPEISNCGAALVYCVESGTVLWSKNADKKVYPARLTKLMTAILALEAFEDEPDHVAVASQKAVDDSLLGLTMGLEPGEKVSVRDLVAVMIHTGANDAALVVAEEVSGSVEKFVSEMNKKAAEIGMKDTVFTNPTGLHDSNMVTTASDMLRLAIYCTGNQKLLEICSMMRVTVPATNKSDERAYGTTNYLISPRVNEDYYLEMADGMICGSTDAAGFCIIATARNNGISYISVVMNAKEKYVEIEPATITVDEDGNQVVTPAVSKTVINGFVDSANLLKWADNNYKYYTAAGPTTPICQVEVKLARYIDNVVLLPKHPIEVLVPVDIDPDKDLSYSYKLKSDTVTAPVKAGQEMGNLTVSYKGEVLGEVPLIIMNNIEQSAWLTLLDGIGKLLSTPLFKVIITSMIVAGVLYIIANAITRSKKKEAARRAQNHNTQYLNKK